MMLEKGHGSGPGPDRRKDPAVVYAMLMGETYLYQITIEDELDDRWPEWFEGVDITMQAGPGGIPVKMLAADRCRGAC
jgi:hypothetical protein